MTDRLNSGSVKQPKFTPQELCDQGNARLAGTEPTMKGEYLPPRHDVEWAVFDNRPTLRWKKSSLAMLRDDAALKPVMDRRGQPMSESDTFELNKELEKLGATKRYRSDGSKYDVGAI